MKITFTILSFILILGGSAAAQESDVPANEPAFIHATSDINLNEDKPLIFEFESKSVKKDTLQIKVLPSAKTKTDQKPSSSANEDALSFNFLYYIIQKFKISDLIDN